MHISAFQSQASHPFLALIHHTYVHPYHYDKPLVMPAVSRQSHERGARTTMVIFGVLFAACTVSGKSTTAAVHLTPTLLDDGHHSDPKNTSDTGMDETLNGTQRSSPSRDVSHVTLEQDRHGSSQDVQNDQTLGWSSSEQSPSPSPSSALSFTSPSSPPPTGPPLPQGVLMEYLNHVADLHTDECFGAGCCNNANGSFWVVLRAQLQLNLNPKWPPQNSGVFAPGVYDNGTGAMHFHPEYLSS